MAKPSKFFNKKTKGYDSKKEAKRANELKLLERSGVISDLKTQVVFELQPSFKAGVKTERAIKYIADFVYVRDGKQIVEDVKGFKTDVYRLKRKLLLYKFKNIVFMET